MAHIYEVEVRKKYWQPGLPARLALKVADDSHQSALVAEADYLSRFDHPNVVKIFPLPGYHKPVYAAKERFTFGWRWYYAMEMLDGGSLESTLTRPSKITDPFRANKTPERPLPLAVCLGIGYQLTEALAHIHGRAVINLDVKPGNILFRRQRGLDPLRSSIPRVVLSDFGIARDKRIPRFGVLGVATPEYVSPEHAREIHGEETCLDERADIFSLGVVLYEILTGQLPFEHIVSILSPDYVPAPPSTLRPGIPDSLDYVVMRALRKDLPARYQTASEMGAALHEVGTLTDWGVLARRIFLGVTLAAGLAGSAYGLHELLDRPADRKDVPAIQVEVSPTVTFSPSPVTATPDVKKRTDPTSTPRPTSTSTPTLRPLPTATPTPASAAQEPEGKTTLKSILGG